MKNFIESYLEEVAQIAKTINKDEIVNVANEIIKVRANWIIRESF